MNFDMFSNNQMDNMDPNYIYPRPYLDPMMFFNPYAMNYQNQMNQNMVNYMSHMNPFMPSPNSGDDNDQPNYSFDNEIDDMYDMNNGQEVPNNMQGMHGMGMPPGMHPGMGMMPNMGMYPGMGMMMPGMMPNMGMYPFMQMMPGMEAINIEEFDEEEM